MNEVLLNDPQYTIRTKWEEFAKRILPTTPRDSIQYKEMRRAFYSGFASFMFNINEMPEGALDAETYTVMCGNWYREFNILIGVERSLKAIRDQIPTKIEDDEDGTQSITN